MRLHIDATAEVMPSRHCFKLGRGVMGDGVIWVGKEAVGDYRTQTDGTEDQIDPVGQG